MDDLERRLYKLEYKAELLNPSGFTAKSFWTRVGTVALYNLIISIIFGIAGLFIFLAINMMS